MKPQDWIKTSDDSVERLVSETHLLDEVANHNPLAKALSTPHSGAVRTRVADDRCFGCRKFEGELVERHLFKSGITAEEMAAALDVNRSTIDRSLRGQSCSTVIQRIRDHYRDELSDLEWPTQDRISVEGYCYAIRKLEADLREMRGVQEAVGRPAMNEETFCYLWHTLASVEWQRAHESQRDEDFDRAAASIHQRVIDPRIFPTCQAKYEKSRQSIEGICRKWDVPFYIAVCSSVDVLRFQP